MMNQKWIKSEGKALFSVTRTGTRGQSPCVLLLAGFSLPMCDEDYFFTKTANALFKEGFTSVQVDLTGHGDSPGNLEDVSLEVLRQDMASILHQLEENGAEEIVCIGRGINPVLLAEMEETMPQVKAIIGVNPYNVRRNQIAEIYSGEAAAVISCSDFLEGTDYSNLTDFNKERMLILEALGARIRNLHGQKLSGKLFEGLLELDATSIMKKARKCYWIIPGSGEELGYKVIRANAPDSGANARFIRDPQWQWSVIREICHIVHESGECCYANSNSIRG
jgi:pimeloyl-ACP methyl ester carboxylesterase